MHSIEPTIKVCSSFPRLDQIQISRDNFIESIEMQFSENCGVVSVNGPLGIGKTTILANFALKKNNNCLCIFAKPTSKMTYDPQLLFFDLCNQLSNLLYQNEIESDQEIDESLYREMLFKLQRRASRQMQYVYFIVDGLDDIPKGSEYSRDYLFGLLPFDQPSFRILLTNIADYVSDTFSRTCKYNSLAITPFSFQETTQYFNNLSLDEPALREIHRTCKGNPSSLSSVRRILCLTGNKSDVISKLPDTMKELYDKEWTTVNSLDEKKVMVLACIAHIPTNHTFTELQSLFSIDKIKIHEFLKNFSFINITCETEEINYVSESYRQFAVDKLKDYKVAVNDLLIDCLMRNPNSTDAIENLPIYLKEANKPGDVLSFLSPDNFLKMIELKQSYIPIQHQTDIGIEAALKLNQDQDLVKLCTYRSSLIEFCQSSVWQSQVDSRIALSDYEGALRLAQQDCMKEDRLQLLATIARATRAAGKAVEPAIIDQIRSLVKQIDAMQLGERALEIACDLLYSLPELAIQLVEASKISEPNENTIDWAFARLSVEAVLASKVDNSTTHSPNPLELISAKVNDPKTRRFTDAAGVLFGNYSASHVISEANRIEGASSKLLILRQWCLANFTNEDALSVIDFAFKLAIRVTDYSPNARVYREIATPLAYSTNLDFIETLIRCFDSQKGNIEKIGPTQEFIWLQLIIAQAEAKINFSLATERLIDTYLSISEINDLALKGDCLANFVSYLKLIDPFQKTNEGHKLWEIASADFEEFISKMLLSTGEHYYIMRKVISSLAKADISRAVSLSCVLNTEPRRDKALIDIIKAATNQPCSDWNVSEFIRCLDKISDHDVQDDGLLRIVERVALFKQIPENVALEIIKLKERIFGIASAHDACRCMCLLYNIVCQFTNLRSESLEKNILVTLENRWNDIDVAWVRVDVGFRISSALALFNKPIASRFASNTEKLMCETPLNTEPSAITYISCLKLALRAYSGLLNKEYDSKVDIQQIDHVIMALPSYGERAKLWSDLALRFWLKSNFTEFNNIVNSYIKPAFNNINLSDSYYRRSVWANIAPSLFLADSATFLHTATELPRQDRDESFNNIATFILHHQLVSDPYDAPKGVTYELVYSDIEYLITIMRALETDHLIYALVNSIVDNLISHNKISQLQKADIISKLEEIIRNKFPNQIFIKHEGYLIAAKSQIARLKKQNQSYWDTLIKDAKLIPNVADSAFVCGIISSCIPRKFSDLKNLLISDTKKAIDTIPALYDKIIHLESLSQEIAEFDRQQCRKLIREAMFAACSYQGGEIASIQRRLIDAAYRIDSEFASSLASIADDDPAKKTHLNTIKERITVQKAKAKLFDQSVPFTIDKKEQAELPRIAWLYLGALNAGRVASLKFDDKTRNMLQYASKKPISIAYPIFACIIEGLCRKYYNTNESTKIIRPIYSSFLLSAQLSAKIAAKRLHITNVIQSIPVANLHSTIIKPGDRDLAFNTISTKLRNIIDDNIYIADPYFGPDELALLKIIQELNPTSSIVILTSRSCLENAKVVLPWSDTFEYSWNMLSDMSPPETRIVVVAVEPDNSSPIHDRWIVTNKGGLRVGTSINSIGITKISDISELSVDDAKTRMIEISRFTNLREKIFNGKKIRYSEFSL